MNHLPRVSLQKVMLILQKFRSHPSNNLHILRPCMTKGPKIKKAKSKRASSLSLSQTDVSWVTKALFRNFAILTHLKKWDKLFQRSSSESRFFSVVETPLNKKAFLGILRQMSVNLTFNGKREAAETVQG